MREVSRLGSGSLALLAALATRNLLRARLRAGLTLAAIALGVASLVVTGGFVQDVYTKLGEATIHSQLGHLQIYRAGYYEHGSRKPLEYLIDDPEGVVRAVGALPEARLLTSRLYFSAVLNDGSRDLGVSAEGVLPGNEEEIGSLITLRAGKRLDERRPFGLLVGEGVAKRMSLSPGSRVTLVASSIEGALNTVDLVVAGVFRTFSKEYDDRTVRLNLATAQELLVTNGVNAIVVLLRSTSATDAAKHVVATSAAATGTEVKTWIELSDFYRKTIDLYRRQFGFLQVIMLVMVVLSVTNSVNMTTFERLGEFGTMRVLGNPSRLVFWVVMVENALLGAVGALIGLVLGVAVSLALTSIGIPMPPPPNAETGYVAGVELTIGSVLVALAIGFFATLAAAVWPARRVSRVPLVDALRQNV